MVLSLAGKLSTIVAQSFDAVSSLFTLKAPSPPAPAPPAPILPNWSNQCETKTTQLDFDFT